MVYETARSHLRNTASIKDLPSEFLTDAMVMVRRAIPAVDEYGVLIGLVVTPS